MYKTTLSFARIFESARVCSEGVGAKHWQVGVTNHTEWSNKILYFRFVSQLTANYIANIITFRNDTISDNAYQFNFLIQSLNFNRKNQIK